MSFLRYSPFYSSGRQSHAKLLDHGHESGTSKCNLSCHDSSESAVQRWRMPLDHATGKETTMTKMFCVSNLKIILHTCTGKVCNGAPRLL